VPDPYRHPGAVPLTARCASPRRDDQAQLAQPIGVTRQTVIVFQYPDGDGNPR